MAWNRRRMLTVAAWLGSVVAANYLGGVVGFSQGMATELTLSGSHAFATVGTLRLLRSGRTAEALRFLEIQLDAEIAQSVFGGHSYGSLYNFPMRLVFPDAPELNAWFLSQVLQYREKYPSMGPDPFTNATLMRALATYRNAPRPNLRNDRGQPLK